jgi:D-alanyl-D-alanine carboxypeptidase/D-alanyl-D-alanine-endopeptidase (penicillin-binding protein 4)
MSNRINFATFLCLLSLLVFALGSIYRAQAGIASATELETKFGARLKKELEKSGLKAVDFGIWVGARSEASGEIQTFYSQNADRLFIPASTSKLITLAAVLHELKPGFKFKTTLLASSPISDGALNGSLFLKGAGDPSFVSENMWFLVNELIRAGVTRIDGDIIVDDTRFDQVRWGDDRQEERVDRAYDAPLGAMSMNWNSVNVFVRPGTKAGEKARVFVDVASPYIKVRNETKTNLRGRGKSVTIERVAEKGFNGDVLFVTGSIALEHEELTVYKNITQPDLWAGFNLIEFLRQRGIVVGGKVRAGHVPKDATILATAESKSLSFIVADMAKWSNNYVADMLVKNLAAESGEIPATIATGLERVLKYLDGVGIKRGDYQFVNAAGFTRKNKMTPRQMGKVLETVRSDFVIFPEYLQALPIGGVDGTLRNRMKGSRAEHWVRAKTGLLNGVASLSGYAGRGSGQIIAFSFFYNGGGALDRVRNLFDQMSAHLVEE